MPEAGTNGLPGSRNDLAPLSTQGRDSSPSSAVSGQLGERLRTGLAALRQGTDPAQVHELLAGLKSQILQMPPAEAAEALRAFLGAGEDAALGLGFVVGGGGWLTEAPTLRVFLLDLLGQVDPAAAAACARDVLASVKSSDEWAVALRNVARGEPDSAGRTFLEERITVLLRHEPWQREASVGYLEAFDVAVFLGGTNLVPVLSDLLRLQDNPAVAHASYLALDRLVIQDAATTLEALQAAPELMRGREATRANYFARADVRDPRQHQVLESYLLDPQMGADELGRFAGLYANANYMVSQNLLTPSLTPDGTSLGARDAASLQVLEQWAADPRFAARRPALDRIRHRLEGFAEPGR